MSRLSSGRPRGRRHAIAAVELALMLPFLVFTFLAGVDFARIFYYQLTLTNCARNGAAYGSTDPTHSTDTAGIQSAAQADASNLSPLPSVNSQTGTDGDGNPFVVVTVSYTFNTVVNYPGIPATTSLAQKCQMRVSPASPKGG